LPFLPFALSLFTSALSFSSYFMSSSTVGAVEVSILEPSSTTIRLPYSSSGGGGTLPCSPILDIFSISD
jgi:hypothetical protein